MVTMGQFPGHDPMLQRRIILCVHAPNRCFHSVNGGISSLLSSLDPEQRAKQSFPYEGSYVVELNRALVTPTFSLTRLQENNLLTDELKHEILSIDGVSGIVCQQEICVTIDGMETAIRSMNAQYNRCPPSEL